MKQAAKFLFLVALTYLIFAFSILIDKGAFVLPIPLNDMVIFVGAFQIAYWSRKTKWIIAPMMAIGLLALLKNILHWEIVLSYEQLVALSNSSWLDLFALLFHLVLLTFGTLLIGKSKSKGTLIFGIVFVAAICCGVIFDYAVLRILSFIAMTIATAQSSEFPHIYAFWALLGMLEIARFLTFLLA